MSETTGQKRTKQYSLFEDSFAYNGEEGKTCSKCNTYKPLEMFPWKSGEKAFRTAICRSCENYLRKFRRNLRNTYGDPPKDYSCPICKGTVDTLNENIGGKHAGFWAVDHCHETEKFRGWLCHMCNITLGGFKDDIKLMERAIRYLKNE
tara:strand:+ start:264 stop:710 length:447 start_codon:yes stop_codon:yes gene_type:complete